MTRPPRDRTLLVVLLSVGCVVAVGALSLPAAWRAREHARARDLEGQALYAQATGDGEKALALFRDAAPYGLSSEGIVGVRKLGSEALRRRGQEPLARDAFRLLCSLSPGDAEAWFAYGTAAAASADWQAAVEGFEKAESLRPRWAEARANRGICLVWAGQGGRAIEALTSVIAELEAPPARLFTALGRAELERTPADLAAARTAFEQAQARDPRLAEAALGLALVANARGDAKEREASLERARLLDPNSAEVLVVAGALHARAGEEQKAREDLSLALVVSPHHAIAHYDLGCLYLRQRDGRKAEAQFRAAVESSPHDPLARLGWALALRLEGRSEEAERQLEAALERKPPHAAIALAHAELRRLGPESEPEPERMSPPAPRKPPPSESGEA